MRGIRNIQTFIAADALLAVVLLVWGQFWTRTFEFPAAIETNVGVGLIWTYFAVFISLLALILAVWHSLKEGNNEAPKFAIALFGTSAVMAIINVSQSIVSIFKKLMMPDMSIYSSLDLSVLECWFLWLAGVWAVLVLIGTGLFICRTPEYKESKCELSFWRSFWIILGVIVLFLLWYFWRAF